MHVARWKEYFADLFHGRVLLSIADSRSAPLDPVPVGLCDPTPDDVAKQIGKLSAGKAAGLDGICAELLKAGGRALANLLHPVVSRM